MADRPKRTRDKRSREALSSGQKDWGMPKAAGVKVRGTRSMIDRIFDRVARVIELVLAVAFIFAVLLNFANVVGRYLFGTLAAGRRRGADLHHGRDDVSSARPW